MSKLSALVAPEQHLVRKIVWTSETHQNTALSVSLEYIAPEALRERQEQNRHKIVGVRKLNNVEDLTQLNEQLNLDWQKLLASRVVKVEGLTIRKLKNLISLDASAVKDAGGLETEIPLDSTDTTPLSEEDQKAYSGTAKTKGEAARQEIAYLIRVHPGFRTFVENVITDVSYFQDSDWESQAKNS